LRDQTVADPRAWRRQPEATDEMTTFGRIMATVEWALERLAGFLLILLFLLINVEVAARYLFNTSTLIADEYGGYLMAWMVMLGALHLLRSDQHLSIRGLVERLSPRGRNAAGILAALIGLFISAVLLYATAMLVITNARFGTVSVQPSRTPLAWPQIIMPVGYVLLCIAYIDELVLRVRGLPPRRSDTEIRDLA
jgi:TRAP-type C4-dicarboxylate transport system permease small subunit